MLRVTSRQRLVSWDAFDATATSTMAMPLPLNMAEGDGGESQSPAAANTTAAATDGPSISQGDAPVPTKIEDSPCTGTHTAEAETSLKNSYLTASPASISMRRNDTSFLYFPAVADHDEDEDAPAVVVPADNDQEEDEKEEDDADIKALTRSIASSVVVQDQETRPQRKKRDRDHEPKSSTAAVVSMKRNVSFSTSTPVTILDHDEHDDDSMLFPSLPDHDAPFHGALSLLSPSKSRGSCASFMTACASSDSIEMMDMACTNAYLDTITQTHPTKTVALPKISKTLHSKIPAVHVVGLSDVPEDVKEIVFGFLKAPEIRALGATCKTLQQLSRSTHVWNTMLYDKFPLLRQLQLMSSSMASHHGKSRVLSLKYHDDRGCGHGTGVPTTPHGSNMHTPKSENSNHSNENSNDINLSALYALAQPYPTHIDDAFFKPPPPATRTPLFMRNSRQRPTAAFRTFTYRLPNSNNNTSIVSVPVVQFTGRVGMGDRCVQSNVAFPSVMSECERTRNRSRGCCRGTSPIVPSSNNNTLAKWCPQSLLDLLRRGGASTLYSMNEGALAHMLVNGDHDNVDGNGDGNEPVPSAATDASVSSWPGPSAFASAASAPFHFGTTAGAGAGAAAGGRSSPPLFPLPFGNRRGGAGASMPTNPAQIMSRTWHLCGITTLKPFVAPYVVHVERPLKHHGHHHDTRLGDTSTAANHVASVLDVNLSPRLFAYFEVTILERDEAQEPEAAAAIGTDASTSAITPTDCIAIGLASSQFDARHKMPGWCAHSYGYHGDDGGIFHGAGDMLRQFGPRFGNQHKDDANDTATGPTTVGCGMDYANQGIFFTLNGKCLGYGWRGLPFDKMPPLYPTVGVDSNLPLEINFGHRPFEFDVTSSFAQHHEALIDTAFQGFPVNAKASFSSSTLSASSSC